MLVKSVGDEPRSVFDGYGGGRGEEREGRSGGGRWRVVAGEEGRASGCGGMEDVEEGDLMKHLHNLRPKVKNY